MPVGLLKYSDTDDSIILKSTLMSEVAITSPDVGSATASVNAGATFDPIKGMTPNAAGGARFVDLIGASALDYAGQISIDVLTAFIGYPDAPASAGYSGSDGDVLIGGATTRYILQWDSGDGGPTTYGRVWALFSTTASPNGGTPNLNAELNATADTEAKTKVSTLDKGQFTRVTISWIGSELLFYLDGKPIDRAVHATAVNGSRAGAYITDMMKDINVGSYQGGTTGAANGCYFKNLLVSTKPVMLPESHGIGTLALFGHSFVMSYGQYSSYDGTELLDCPLALQIEKELVNRDLYCKPMQFAGVGGGNVSDSQATKLSDHVDTLLSSHPDYVAMIVGTNDLINYVSVDASGNQFEDELKLRIDEIYADANIKGIVLCTIPTLGAGHASYDTAAFRTARANYNASINLMPAYAVSQGYPEIKIADIDTDLGSENPPYPVYFGQIPTDNGNTIHLSGLGNALTAESIVKKLVELLT